MLTYSFDPTAKMPLYEQLYRFIRADIINGTLPANEQLPSKRKFALHLQISNITVETAYAQLLAEGYIYAKPRRGYFVHALMISPSSKPKKEQAPPPSAQSVYRFDFRTNIVDTECFPFHTWAKLSRSVLSSFSDRLLLATEPAGAYELRLEIQNYLYQFRGIDVSAEQIIVGAGTEYLIPLVLQLLGEDRTFALENPGYPKLYQIFKNSGASVASIALDSLGLAVSALEKSDASVVYTTPSHHFPLGLVMPASRRMELLHWATQKPNRYIIEDDYDSEFRYTSRPIPALSELDHAERVIYINTFTKSLSPGLRIGYLVLPESLMTVYREKFSRYSSTVPAFEQYTLAKFLKEGYLERHISRSKKIYEQRLHTLLNALKKQFDGAIAYSVSGAEAGLHILLTIQNGMSEKELIYRAKQVGVRLYGLSDYYIAPPTHQTETLILGYAGLSEEEIQSAIALLKNAWTVS